MTGVEPIAVPSVGSPNSAPHQGDYDAFRLTISMGMTRPNSAPHQGDYDGMYRKLVASPNSGPNSAPHQGDYDVDGPIQRPITEQVRIPPRIKGIMTSNAKSFA